MAQHIPCTEARPESAEERMFRQLGSCLQHGCVVCIEYAHAVRPRFTSWELWGDSCCYNGDLPALLAETEKCRCVHPDKSIRLTVHDFATRSRLSLALNRPQLAA